MMKQLRSSEMFERLRLRSQLLEPLPLDDPAVKNELKLSQMHFRFTIDLAANRLWSQSMFTLLFPWTMCMCFRSTDEELNTVQKVWRRLSNALISLENHVSDKPQDTWAAKLLKDIAVHKWVIVREMFILGRACDWDPRNRDLREQVFALFNGPATTASTLESGFNFVKDHTRQSKGQRMSPYTRYSYLACNPYIKSGGLRTIVASEEDFAAISTSPLSHNAVMSTKPFTASSSPMPDRRPSLKELETKWRPAGYLANRVGVAAMSLAAKTCGSGFQKIQNAWLCCLFVMRAVF